MNEHEIRDALGRIAESGGTPDETAAWGSIAAGIEADRRSATRRKVLIGGAGLALVGAAAAFALLGGTTDDGEAVDVGPADELVEETTTTSTTTPTETTLPAGHAPFPEHPLVVVTLGSDGLSSLDLFDADSGEVVTSGLATSPFSFSEISVRPDGTIFYTEEVGDSSTVRMIAWDGSVGPLTPFGIPEDEGTNGGAMSPDGSTFAFVEHGVTRTVARIGLVDIATGDIHYIEYEVENEGGIHDLEFSPDGESLAFENGGADPAIRLIAVDADRLDETTIVDFGYAPAWRDAGHLAYAVGCCASDAEEPIREYVVATGESTAFEPIFVGGLPVESMSSDWDGRLAAVIDGGVVVFEDGVVRSILVDGTALAVGM